MEILPEKVCAMWRDVVDSNMAKLGLTSSAQIVGATFLGLQEEGAHK